MHNSCNTALKKLLNLFFPLKKIKIQISEIRKPNPNGRKRVVTMKKSI